MARLHAVDATFLDNAPKTFGTSAVVDASPDRVWAEIIEDGWTAWFPDMSECVYSTPRPRGIGSVRTVKIKGLVVEERVVQFEPEQSWAFCGITVNIPFAKRLIEGFALETLDDSNQTRLSYQAGLELSWATRPFSRLIERQMTAGWALAISNLDAHLQSR